MIDTAGLSRAEILKALFDYSKPQGPGFLHIGYYPHGMSVQEAENRLEHSTEFEYVNGRILKVDLSNILGFDETEYDENNGMGTAQSAIDNARRQKGL